MPEALALEVTGSDLAAPAFSGQPGDFQKDMALLAKEQGMAQPMTLESSTATPEQPAQPQATVTEQPETGIPDKFKGPDGSVSVERIEKSTVNAQEAYERYRQAELALQAKRNEVNRQQYQQPQYQPQVNQPVYTPAVPNNPTVPMSLAQQINAELAANQSNPGAVLEKLFHAAANMGYQQATAEIQNVRQETELVKRQRELEVIAQKDEWVLSPEGTEALSKIRAERPWVNNSPTPWTSAYKELIADRVLNGGSVQSVQQVKTPNPKVLTAPAAPVGSVDRTQRQPVRVDTADKQSLDSLFKAKTPQEEAAMFKQLGFNVDRWMGK